MNNFERGDKAERALEAAGYAPVEDTIDNEVPLPNGELVVAFEGYVISDLIADLCHLAQRHGLAEDIAALVAAGVEHYGADCVEQAWENSDEWDNELQSKDNLPRAERILSLAGVPAVFWAPVMIKLGLITGDEREEYAKGLEKRTKDDDNGV